MFVTRAVTDRAFDVRRELLIQLRRVLLPLSKSIPPIDETISIESALQKAPEEGEARADIVLVTHETTERAVRAAIAKIEALGTTHEQVILLRIEKLS